MDSANAYHIYDIIIELAMYGILWIYAHLIIINILIILFKSNDLYSVRQYLYQMCRCDIQIGQIQIGGTFDRNGVGNDHLSEIKSLKNMTCFLRSCFTYSHFLRFRQKH